MAKIVTLEILVDSDDESEIADGLNDMLRTAQIPVDPDDADARSWIIDWRLGVAGDQLRLQSISPSVEDAIVNGTYSEGDAFPSTAAPLHPGLEYTDRHRPQGDGQLVDRRAVPLRPAGRW